MNARKVAVLGATGVVGQRFLRLLDGHPWFRVAEVVASDTRRGKPYGEAVQWLDRGDPQDAVRDLELKGPDDDLDADLVFSALPSGTAGPLERSLAARGFAVFTNAADLRMEEDVPIVVPEVNPEHLSLAEDQRVRNAGGGFVVANGNCTAILLSLALKPLRDRFGLRACHVVTLQALSGAGYPGVPGLDALGNVLPYIPQEEGKVESEPQKILGTAQEGRIVRASFPLSATCMRVPVLEGHTEAVTVRLEEEASADEIRETLRAFRGRPQALGLPSAPRAPLVYRDEADRPQPRRDGPEGGGMTVAVGRLRPDPILGWKFVVAGSNTVRGAAGGSILAAELALASGLLS